jgi:hypothetical protein
MTGRFLASVTWTMSWIGRGEPAVPVCVLPSTTLILAGTPSLGRMTLSWLHVAVATASEVYEVMRTRRRSELTRANRPGFRGLKVIKSKNGP